MRQLFRRYGTAGHEVLAAIQVGLRLVQVSSPLCHDGRELIAVRENRMHLAHRACQLGFRLAQSDRRVRIVQPDELLTGPHQVSLVGVDGNDRPAHLRHDGDEIAGDVRIVRALIVARVKVPVARRNDCNDGEHERRIHEPTSSPALHQARQWRGRGLGFGIHL